VGWDDAKAKAVEDDDDEDQLADMQWIIPLLAINIIVNDSRLICYFFDFQVSTYNHHHHFQF